MKYLCLVYGDEKALAGMDDRHCVSFDEKIRASGHCVASEGAAAHGDGDHGALCATAASR
jgi:hypothetical protein